MNSIFDAFAGLNPLLIELNKKITAVTKNILTPNLVNLFNDIHEKTKWVEEVKKLDYDGFNEYYSVRILNAQKLGGYGWTISPHTVCNKEIKALRKLEKGQSEKSVIKAFIMKKHIEEKMLVHLEEVYSTCPNCCLYYNHFLSRFKARDYMTSAFYISAIFENRFKKFYTGQYKKIKAILEKAMPEKRKQLFSNAKKAGKVISLIVANDYMISLNAFSERFLTEDKSLSWDNPDNEPQYLNRNWLMHGKVTRKIERYEILQVVNALTTLDALEKEFDELSKIGIGKNK